MNEIQTVLSEIRAYFTDASWFQLGKWPFWVLLFTVAAGGVYTARFGKKTLLCRGICGTINLCGIYVSAIILYTLFPSLRALPFGLPFLDVTDQTARLLDPIVMEVGTLAPILLRMMFLILLVDFLEYLNPGGKTLMSWMLSQVVTVTLSLSTYLVIISGFNMLLPDLSGTYAIIPVVLVAALFLLMISAKFVFTIVLESGNPQFKSIYGFFTTHKGGSLLTVSALSFLFSAALYAVLYVTENYQISFSDANLSGLGFILLLLLIAEYFFAMLYCGKKK